MTSPRLAFIGTGMMAEAMLRGLLARGVTTVDRMIASEPRPERRAEMETAFPGLIVSASNTMAASSADIVVLSIKPQFLDTVATDIRPALHSSQLVLSIMAGVPLHVLTSTLHHAAIVRAMPNTPCLVGEGMTVWVASPSVTPDQAEMAGSIFGALGRAIGVQSESYIDMATSINGSGPAYVLLMIEAMIDAAVQIGLARPMAEEMVTQTVFGTVRLLQETGRHPAELRNNVTSPAGTTAAALYQLEKAGVRAAIIDAVVAAHRRAVELGQHAAGTHS